MLRFEDSTDAGAVLAASLESYHDQTNAVVVALTPRAAQLALSVASALDLPLIVILPKSRFGNELTGRSVILVDRGFATPQEVHDAAATVLLYHPARLILATPVISHEAFLAAARLVDRCIYVTMPTPFHSIGFWYDDTMSSAARALFAGTGRGAGRLPLRS
jgi:predicted phosphoribosyltransferase